MRRLGLLTALLASALCATPAAAQQLVPFGGQTYDNPFYVAGEPGNPSRVYVVESAGLIRLVINGVTQPDPFLDASGEVCDGIDGCDSESGMFSMAFHPNYTSNGLFYVFFTRDVPDPDQHDLVIREFQRSTTDPNDADEGAGRDVLVIQHRDASNHNGGQLQFGPDDLLYISTGDGGADPTLAQDTSSLLGKLLRIDPTGTNPGDYTIPAGNPFADGPGGNADEIYSYGLRNPYRFSFDRLTGDLVIGDVGQVAWEEIDFVSAGAGGGANFGWRCFEGMHVFVTTDECDPLPSNHTPPVFEYANPPAAPAAINGGYVVRDPTVPSLFGRYLYADTFDALDNQIFGVQLCAGGFSGNAPTGLTAGFVVSFGEDAAGRVYVAHGGDTVSRIEQSSSGQPQPPSCPGSGEPPPGGAGASDTKGPGLSVNAGKAKHAADRGEARVVVSCDEPCTVRGSGEIVLAGKDIGLAPDQESLLAGLKGSLSLDLSRGEARRLRRLLEHGRKAKAALDLVASDALGNQGVAEPRVSQKR